MSKLAVYEHAREALAAAVRFDEVTQLHSAAEKAAAYARIARDRRLQADATEIVARAERKLGIMLRQAKDEGLLSKGGRPTERSNLGEPETGADAEPVFECTGLGCAEKGFTLAEIGIDKKLSSRAQKAAELADEDFESAVKDRREKILATDAPVVAPRKIKPVKVAQPGKGFAVGSGPGQPQVKPLEPRRFHQFAFAVLALSVASDRVGSRAIQFLARDCGLLVGDDDDLDFSPEAAAAMGNILVAALSALGGEMKLPETAEDCPQPPETDQRLSVAGPEDTAGRQSADTLRAERERPGEGVTAGETAPLSTAEADAIIRAAYAANAGGAPIVGHLAEQIGRPGKAGKAYVRNRARVMGLSSRENQRAAASAFATSQHAARREPAP